MAKHLQTGKQGEKIAVEFLMQQGYKVLHINWRYSYYEIDLIVWKDPLLHFIEIKTRSSNRFGNPEESVTIKKMKSIMRAAEEFLSLHPEFNKVQYDILCVMLNNNSCPEFYLLEDVYYYGNNLAK